MLIKPEALDSEDFRKWLNTKMSESKNLIDGFADHLIQNPYEAFYWGQSAVLAAANIKIINFMQQWMSSANYVAEDLAQNLEQAFLMRAGGFGSSTNSVNNVLTAAEVQAYTAIIQRLRRGF